MLHHRYIRTLLELSALALLVLSIGLPRLAGLARYVTPDEYMWLTRSANFYEALKNRDYANTFQRSHPGVTILWAGAAGMLRTFPSYTDLNQGQVGPDQFHKIIESKRSPVSMLALLREDRLILVIAQTALLLLSYLYARRLLGTLPALLGFLLIAFDPFHLGLTRLLHLDGLMTNFILLSLLAFLVYQVNRNWLNLLVSGAAAGFGLLTKSPAVLLIPVIGLLALLELWKAARSEGFSWKLFSRYAWPVLLWFVTGAVVFTLFWPAMWVHPIQTVAGVFSLAQEYAEEGHSSELFFNGRIIPDGDLGLTYFYFYPLTYLWRVTPVVLVGLVLALWGWLRRRAPFDKPEVRRTVLGLLLFTLIFFFVITLGAKKFDRYLLPVYPALDLIAGLGWFALLAYLWGREVRGAWRLLPIVILVIAVASQVTSAMLTYPYYLSYYNPLMGGSRKAPQVMQIGWGEGIDQAARYLNQKPHAEKLKVISWYDTGSFSYFFNGANRTFWSNTDKNPDNWKKFITSDYAVIYVGQWQRRIPESVLDYLATLEPEKTIWINGLEYVRIYKLH